MPTPPPTCVHLNVLERFSVKTSHTCGLKLEAAWFMELYLPDVVKISVRNTFQFLQLGHLVEHFMEVEL